MTPSKDTKNPYLSPDDLFASYALMRGTKEALPETKAYHEKRWRFMAGLFGINYRAPDRMVRDCESGTGLLEGLIRERNKLEYSDLLSVHDDRAWGKKEQELYDHYKNALAEKVDDLRGYYAQIGGELFVRLFPEIEGFRVLRTRLEELGLPSTPPEPRAEMMELLESRPVEKRETMPPLQIQKLKDDITRDRIISLKVSEEVHARGAESHAQDVDMLRQRALDWGLASAESVDSFIFEMPVQDFLKLAKGFPTLSRIDFRPPEPPKQAVSPGVLAQISAFLSSNKPQAVPIPINIPEEPLSLTPDPLREQLERLRKENPGLFKEYSDAHITHAMRFIFTGESCRNCTVDNEF